MTPDHFHLENFVSDLTGRQESLLTKDLRANDELLRNRITGKHALVIGGAGTIGSSYVRAMIPYEPASLCVVDTNENGLTELVRDLRSTDGITLPSDFRFYPMSLGDPAFRRLLKDDIPFEIVANFAAHKHVRSEKDRFSIEAMLRNNVLHAKALLDQLLETPPERFFCVSTDKATNPVNIMGASKSLMERLIMAYSSRFPVTTARFANVAFSNGSLLDGFLHRIQKQQPLSAPLDVRRYFVSPLESGQICLLACMLGDSSEIFFPKLDYNKDLLTFAEIADRLLQQLGWQPKQCETEDEARKMAQRGIEGESEYPCYFFNSDTTGEKPVEEFFSEDETVDMERHHALGVITSITAPEIAEVSRMATKLEQMFENDLLDKATIVETITEFAPNFTHVETGKNLDQKM